VRPIPKQVFPSIAAATLLTVGFALALSGALVNRASGGRATGHGACPSASGREIVLTVPLPGRPRFLLLTRKTLWVAVRSSRPGGRGRLVRVDARSGRVQRILRLDVDPYRLAYGFGSLWITGETSARRYQGALLRVDPRSGHVVQVIRGPRLFGAAVATTADAVWVGGADIYAQGQGDKTVARFVFKIDPERNAVVRQVHLTPTTVIDLIGDGRSLWATGWGAVVKLSTTGRLLFQQRFGGSGWALALAPGAVWVAQPFFGNRRNPQEQRPARRLVRLMTSGLPRVTVVELDGPPGDVSAAEGAVWVGAGGLVRIDGTRTAPTLTKVAPGVVPNRIEAFPGGAWVAELDTNELSKIC
jgi:hypothetical protein